MIKPAHIVRSWELGVRKIKELLPNYELRTTNSKGFTLIELLVVIAVIAVLAAVVIAAINPLEQIRRGRDSKVKQDIAVISRAMEAFYTASGTSGGQPYFPGSLNDMTVSQDLDTIPLPPPGGTTGVPGCTAAAYCYAEVPLPTGTCDGNPVTECQQAIIHYPMQSVREQVNAFNLALPGSGCTNTMTAALNDAYWVYKTTVPVGQPQSPNYYCNTALIVP